MNELCFADSFLLTRCSHFHADESPATAHLPAVAVPCFNETASFSLNELRTSARSTLILYIVVRTVALASTHEGCRVRPPASQPAPRIKSDLMSDVITECQSHSARWVPLTCFLDVASFLTTISQRKWPWWAWLALGYLARPCLHLLRKQYFNNNHRISESQQTPAERILILATSGVGIAILAAVVFGALLVALGIAALVFAAWIHLSSEEEDKGKRGGPPGLRYVLTPQELARMREEMQRERQRPSAKVETGGRTIADGIRRMIDP